MQRLVRLTKPDGSLLDAYEQMQEIRTVDGKSKIAGSFNLTLANGTELLGEIDNRYLNLKTGERYTRA